MSFFSIIIPTFNSGASVEAAVESVINQSYQDWELLVMDGASRDDTLDKVAVLASGESRIRLFSEKDSGVYDAMNKGIAASSGKWLFFLGSDDHLMDQNVLQEVAQAINKCGRVDIIYGDVTSEYLGVRYDGCFDRFKISHSNICHQSIFYNRRVFEVLGVYDLKYRIHADWDMNLRAFLHPELKTQYIDLIVAHFSGGGLSHREDDALFRSEKNQIVVRHGYHTIPLTKLKYFCRSNGEFIKALMKRVLYRFTH